MNTQKQRRMLFFSFLFATLISYQNCSQQYDVELNTSAPSQGSLGTLTDDELKISTVIVGHSETAPLKLFFIVDNSNSMALNNYNLQKSISAIFNPSLEKSLSEFDAEIFFITTAQLSTLNSALNENSILSPEKYLSVKNITPANLANQLQLQRNNTQVSGLIAGDILGFKILSPESAASLNPSAQVQKILPAPVSEFIVSEAQVKVLPSIQYKKGGSLADLQSKVASRLSVILPQKTQHSGIAPFAKILDQESGMCAMARILRNPSGYLANGDLASFIIVSDEEESDLNGANCIQSISKEKRINAKCIKNIPARNYQEKTITYLSAPGEEKVKLSVALTPKDVIKNRVETTFNLTPKPSSCEIAYQKQFQISYALSIPQYTITFEKADLLFTREGDSKVYSDYTTNTSSQFDGAAPSNCNEAFLRSKVSISNNSLVKNIVCSNGSPKILSNQTITSNISAFPTINPSQSTVCSPDLQTLIQQKFTVPGTTIQSCQLVKKEDFNTVTQIANNSFFESNECTNYAASFCNISNGANIGCRVHQFIGATAKSVVPSHTVTTDTGLSCSSSCAQVVGLCATGSTSASIEVFASTNGYSCSSINNNSTQTYTVAQAIQNKEFTLTLSNYQLLTNNGALSSCDLTCAQSGLCSGSTSLKDAHKSCLQTNKQNIAATQSTLTKLIQVEDANNQIQCSSQCSSKPGLCGSNSSSITTVEQYIINTLKGSQCLASNSSKAIAASQDIKSLTNVLNADLIQQCSAEYVLDPNSIQITNTLVTQNNPVVEPVGVNGTNPNLPDYIKYKVNELFGKERASLTSFVTTSNHQLSTATSVGTSYINLTQALSGTAHSIRLESYAPAFENLGGVLNNLLHRSFKIPQMSGSERVINVYLLNTTTGKFEELPKGDWTSTGNSITLAQNVHLEFEDQLRIEYK